MTPEQLLRPRIKVIADWPGNKIFKVGDIIEISSLHGDLIYCDTNGPRYSHYPHLFREMNWWEDRAIEDMPEYVKLVKGEHIVLKVKEHVLSVGAILPNNKKRPYSSLLPATEAEYNEADFVYTCKGVEVIEDVKSAASRKLRVYRLKKKLMKAELGIEIKEV